MNSKVDSQSSAIFKVHDRANLSFSRGEGLYLYGTDGKKYLDFAAGIAVNSLGHCHPEVNKALIDQAQKLWHVSNIYRIPELESFAEKLTSSTFADKVFFCNSGAEANECAIKMIRRWQHFNYSEKKHRIICFTDSFHGRTIANISTSNKKRLTEGFSPMLEGFDIVEPTKEAVQRVFTENTAGILIEPIQGEGGVHVMEKEFLLFLREICNKNDSILSFDEIQCGFGRTGELFYYQNLGLAPDVLTSAKGIANGFPLGACLATERIASCMTTSTHGTTYGSNPLAMKVGEKVLEIVLGDGFLDNVKKMSNVLWAKLTEVQKNFPHIVDKIVGLGLMVGLKIKEPYINKEINEEFKKNLLLCVNADRNVIRILPPLILNESHIREACECISKSLQSVKTL